MSFLMRPAIRVLRQRTRTTSLPTRNYTQPNQPPPHTLPKTTPQPPPPAGKSRKVFYVGVTAGLAGGYYYLWKNDKCPIMNKYFNNKCDTVRKVADIDPAAYKLEIKIGPTKAGKIFNFENIKALPQFTMKAKLTCEGSAMKNTILGMDEADWTGAKLSDILIDLGVEAKENREVIFKGADADSSKDRSFSMPIAQALDKDKVVLLAYLKNGKPLEHTHGYPVIALVHGEKGARKVKWLTEIEVTEK